MMRSHHIAIFFLLLGNASNIITAFTSTSNSHNVKPTTLISEKTTVATTSTVLSMASNENDAAKELLDKAAKIRAEIAAMEGKTVEEVEKEAQDKKDAEQSRRDEQQKQKELAMSTSSSSSSSSTDQDNNNINKANGRYLQVPNTHEDMVRQAARAVERAFADGITRQTVRFNLINVQEDQSAIEENQWPGGAQQIYRESAKPLTTELLREIRAPTKPEDKDNKNMRKLPPKLNQQDIWDFDGSALHTAEAAEGPSADIQALVLPNTDVKYIKDIEEISTVMKNRLFLLVNPFWRDVESWSFNLLAPNAKQKAQSVIFDNGYDETYNLLVFQVRGENCVGLKVYPYDWQIFAYIEDDYGYESAIRLGECEDQPTSQFVTDLLNKRPEFKQTKTMRQMKKTMNL